jgi:ABC-2 type transport system permease protein
MKAIWQAFVASWRALLADAGVMLLLFGGGVVYAFFYPLPYAHESVQRVPVAVVDQDRSALSRQLVRYLDAHPALQVVQVTPDVAPAQDLLWRNEAGGVLIIPAGMNARVLSGKVAEVELVGHGAYLMLNKAALGGLAEVVGTVSAGIELKRLAASTPSSAQAAAQRQPLGLNSVPLFNVREGYGAYLVPGVAVIIIQQTLLMAVAMLMGTWAERGRVPVPATPAGWCGLWLTCTSAALLNCAWWFGFVLWVQDYPRGGNAAGLAVFAVVFSMCAAALAVLLGAWFRSRERSVQLMLGLAVPILFVAGLSWPSQALPPLLAAVRWVLPSTAGVQGFVALNQLGASSHDIAPELLVLAVSGVLFAALGCWRWCRPRAA